MANQRDVQLVIRARDEGSKAINALVGALDQLLGIQTEIGTSSNATGTALTRLGSTLGLLDAAYSQVAGTAARAGDAVAAQNARLNATEAEYAAVQRQVKSAETAIVSIGVAMGQDRSGPLAARLLAAGQAYRSLSQQAKTLETNLATQRKAVEQSGVAYAGVQNSLLAAKAAVGEFGNEAVREGLRAKAAAEDTALAYRNQAKAAREALAVQARDARLEVRDRENVAAVNTQTGFRNTPSKSARDSAAVFEQTASAQAKLTAEVERFRDRLDPARAAQAALDAELVRARELFQQGRISVRELVGEQKRLAEQSKLTAAALRGNGAKALGGLFGLKPYELQNLGYQVNDLVTQIASGTSVTQALAQQSGQILQLFPRALSGVLKYGRALGLIGVALVPVFLGLSRLFDKQQELRQFNAEIAASGDSATYSGQKLAKAARDIDLYGASAKDAKEAVSALVKGGVDPTQIRAFGIAAQNAADALGIKLVDAAKDAGSAFTGGYKAVAEFDNKLNFLTESERELIRKMFESGQAAEAREKAFGIFYDRMEDGARKARGPWSEAVRSLQGSWTTFIDYLAGSSVIQSLGESLTDAAKGAGFLMDSIAGVNNLKKATDDVNFYTNSIAQLKKDILAFAGTPLAAPMFVELKAYEALLPKAKANLAALQAQAKAAGPGGKPVGGDPRAADAAAAKAHNDRMAELALERTGTLAVAGATNVLAEGQKAYNTELDKSGDIVAANFAKETAMAAARKKNAKELKAAESARVRGFAAEVDETRGQDLITTAKRFNGFSENNPEQNAGLKTLFKQNGMNIDPKITAWCAAFVNAVLGTNGLPGSKLPNGAPNLGARSFLNYGSKATEPKSGDIVVLKRGGRGGAASGQGHVGFFEGFDAKGNVKVLGGNQGGGQKVSSQTFNRKDVLGFRRAPGSSEVATDRAKLADAQYEAQLKLNDALDDEGRKRKRNTDNQVEQNSLQGLALIAAQRKQAVENAVATEIQKADDASDTLVKAGGERISLSEKQLELVRATAAAEFDAANAKAIANEERDQAERAVNTLIEQRQQLQQRIQFAGEQGQAGVVAELETQLDTVNVKLAEATTKAIAFWRAIQSDPAKLALLGQTPEQIDNVILGLENNRAGAQSRSQQFLGNQVGPVVEQAKQNQLLIDNQKAFHEKIKQLEQEGLLNHFAAQQAKFDYDARVQESRLEQTEGFLGVLASLQSSSNEELAGIGRAAAIVQATIDGVVAVQRALASAPPPFNFIAAGLVGAAAAINVAKIAGFEQGGYTGNGGTKQVAGVVHGKEFVVNARSTAENRPLLEQINKGRSVGDFLAKAQSNQNGGSPGLKGNEMSTILKKVEQGLEGSPRNARPGGGGASPSIRNVLVFGDEEVAGAMAGPAGERVFINHMRRNAPLVKQFANS